MIKIDSTASSRCLGTPYEVAIAVQGSNVAYWRQDLITLLSLES